jgi:hypothetical protein
MLGKFLLTVAVIVLAFYAVRQRYLGDAKPRGAAEQPADSSPRHRLIQIAAAAVVAIMLAGSGWALLRGLVGTQDGGDVVVVEVVNPTTGTADRFEAHRADIDERAFTTTDGRRIQVSEVERIVVLQRR